MNIHNIHSTEYLFISLWLFIQNKLGCIFTERVLNCYLYKVYFLIMNICVTIMLHTTDYWFLVSTLIFWPYFVRQ